MNVCRIQGDVAFSIFLHLQEVKIEQHVHDCTNFGCIFYESTAQHVDPAVFSTYFVSSAQGRGEERGRTANLCADLLSEYIEVWACSADSK